MKVLEVTSLVTKSLILVKPEQVFNSHLQAIQFCCYHVDADSIAIASIAGHFQALLDLANLHSEISNTLLDLSFPSLLIHCDVDHVQPGLQVSHSLAQVTQVDQHFSLVALQCLKFALYQLKSLRYGPGVIVH